MSPVESHVRLGLTPLPFLDLRKELVDFRKLLKKRWAWACPGEGVWRPPHPTASRAHTCRSSQRRQGSAGSPS